jgi:hypothetical protein
MQPYALPRASSRRVRHLAVRSHFHQPRAAVRPFRSHWNQKPNPFRVDWPLVSLAVVVGFLSVMLVACGVIS